MFEAQHRSVIVSPAQCPSGDLVESQRVARLATNGSGPVEEACKNDATVGDDRAVSGRDHRLAGLELRPKVGLPLRVAPLTTFQALTAHSPVARACGVPPGPG